MKIQNELIASKEKFDFLLGELENPQDKVVANKQWLNTILGKGALYIRNSSDIDSVKLDAFYNKARQALKSQVLEYKGRDGGVGKKTQNLYEEAFVYENLGSHVERLQEKFTRVKDTLRSVENFNSVSAEEVAEIIRKNRETGKAEKLKRKSLPLRYLFNSKKKKSYKDCFNRLNSEVAKISKADFSYNGVDVSSKYLDKILTQLTQEKIWSKREEKLNNAESYYKPLADLREIISHRKIQNNQENTVVRTPLRQNIAENGIIRRNGGKQLS